MVRDKSEIKKRVGILGGTFDPAHKGHIKISLEARKRYKLHEIIWAVTKKNPFKHKSRSGLKERIRYAKKINYKNKFIKVRCYENIINSNRTIDLIKYIKSKNKICKIYFIMGADNLIHFHKWKNSKLISSICKILVFDRNKYKSKCLKSLGFKKYNKKGLEFITFKKVNISSSKLRKI